MRMEWFRSWHGAPTDPKWLSVARRAEVGVDRVICIVWYLMDVASQAEERGDVSGFDAEAFSDFSGIPETEFFGVVAALREKGVLKDFKFTAWEKRQPKRERDDDLSTERVRAFRQRKRTVAPRNATKRLEKRRVDKIREEKKERGRANALPPDWKPSASHEEKGTLLGFDPTQIADMAGDMALWAKANGATKKDWDAAFHGWMRREKKNAKARGNGIRPPEVYRPRPAPRSYAEIKAEKEKVQ